MDKNKVIESASKLISKGQFDKAVKEYQRVLEVDPDDVRVLQKLAELYQKMNRKAEAADCFEKVAKTYAAQGFYLKAVALYKQVLKVIDRVEVNVRLAKLQICFKANPRDLGTLQMLARAFQELGQVSKTVSVLKELARVHLDSGRIEDGRKTYQQAQELAPDDQEVKAALKALEEGEPE